MKKFIIALSLFSGLAMADDCPEGRLYQHSAGETCVADVPQKVVVLEYSFADHLGVLDEKPVGYAKDAMPKYLEPVVEGATQVGARKAPSLEKIAALKPDLIIADKKRHSGIYAQLSTIAPTLIHNSLRGSYDEQIASLKQIADIYKKGDIADNAVKALDDKFAQAKAEAVPTTVLIDVYRPGQHSIHSDQSFMGSLMARIGKTNPIKVRDGQSQYELDLEGIAKINADAMLMMCTDKSQKSVNEFLNNPVVKSLNAVKNNRVYFVNKTLWSKGRGVLGLTHVLQEAKDSGFLENKPSNDTTCKF